MPEGGIGLERATTSTTADRVEPAGVVVSSRVSHVTLIVVAAGTWIGIVAWARRTGNGPGTMGLGLFPFVGMWALMMTAMMVPAVARTAVSGVVTTVRGTGARWSLTFALGYLLLWAATGLPAFGLATAAGALSHHHPDVAEFAAAAILALCGLYQFSRAKWASLAHCRRLHPVELRRSAFRAGGAFGGWCLACSWGTVAVMIVFGVMNLVAMVVASVLVYGERRWSAGRVFPNIVGFVALAFAVVVLVFPGLAAGVHQMPMMM
jgi:predicted metal-binding membrane protein